MATNVGWLDRISITEIHSMTFIDSDNEVAFFVDELQNMSFAQSEEKVPVTGRGGRTLKNIKKNKSVTITGTNGVVSLSLLAAQTGGKVISGVDGAGIAQNIRLMDTVEIKVADKGVTAHKAIGPVGNEIGKVYLVSPTGLTKSFTQAATPATGKFAYDPATKEITFFAGEMAVGNKIIASYEWKAPVKVITNPSAEFSKTFKVIIDCAGNDDCDNQYHTQFIVPRGELSGNFTFEMGENPTVQQFEITALSPPSISCGGTSSSSSQDLWDMVVFDFEAADMP